LGMATVKSQYFAGKTVNVPHTEHRQAAPDEKEKNAVTFSEGGTAKVSERLAKALVEFFPRHVSKSK
jgi:hypothetical protein